MAPTYQLICDSDTSQLHASFTDSCVLPFVKAGNLASTWWVHKCCVLYQLTPHRPVKARSIPYSWVICLSQSQAFDTNDTDPWGVIPVNYFIVLCDLCRSSQGFFNEYTSVQSTIVIVLSETLMANVWWHKQNVQPFVNNAGYCWLRNAKSAFWRFNL